MHTYEDYNRAFAELVASSLALVTGHCRPKEKNEEINLLEKLRAGWSNHIKVLSEPSNRRYEVLEKGLGQYFGALVTHVNAIHEKWKLIENDSKSPLIENDSKNPLIEYDNKNPLIDLEYESDLCCQAALEQALRISQAACAYAANLERAENELLARSLLLAQQLEAYVRRNNILYRSSPHSDCFVFGIHGISAVVLGHCKLECQFYYWDGVDECCPTIATLFTTKEQIAEVRKLADICLGDVGKLGKDLSTIETVAPVPLVTLM